MPSSRRASSSALAPTFQFPAPSTSEQWRSELYDEPQPQAHAQAHAQARPSSSSSSSSSSPPQQPRSPQEQQQQQQQQSCSLPQQRHSPSSSSVGFPLPFQMRPRSATTTTTDAITAAESSAKSTAPFGDFERRVSNETSQSRLSRAAGPAQHHLYDHHQHQHRQAQPWSSHAPHQQQSSMAGHQRARLDSRAQTDAERSALLSPPPTTTMMTRERERERAPQAERIIAVNPAHYDPTAQPSDHGAAPSSSLSLSSGFSSLAPAAPLASPSSTNAGEGDTTTSSGGGTRQSVEWANVKLHATAQQPPVTRHDLAPARPFASDSQDASGGGGPRQAQQTFFDPSAPLLYHDDWSLTSMRVRETERTVRHRALHAGLVTLLVILATVLVVIAAVWALVVDGPGARQDDAQADLVVRTIRWIETAVGGLLLVFLFVIVLWLRTRHYDSRRAVSTMIAAVAVSLSHLALSILNLVLVIRFPALVALQSNCAWTIDATWAFVTRDTACATDGAQDGRERASQVLAAVRILVVLLFAALWLWLIRRYNAALRAYSRARDQTANRFSVATASSAGSSRARAPQKSDAGAYYSSTTDLADLERCASGVTTTSYSRDSLPPMPSVEKSGARVRVLLNDDNDDEEEACRAFTRLPSRSPVYGSREGSVASDDGSSWGAWLGSKVFGGFAWLLGAQSYEKQAFEPHPPSMRQIRAARRAASASAAHDRFASSETYYEEFADTQRVPALHVTQPSSELYASRDITEVDQAFVDPRTPPRPPSPQRMPSFDEPVLATSDSGHSFRSLLQGVVSPSSSMRHVSSPYSPATGVSTVKSSSGDSTPARVDSLGSTRSGTTDTPPSSVQSHGQRMQRSNSAGSDKTARAGDMADEAGGERVWPPTEIDGAIISEDAVEEVALDDESIQSHLQTGSSGSTRGSIVYVRMSDGRLVRRLSTILSLSESVGDGTARSQSDVGVVLDEGDEEVVKHWQHTLETASVSEYDRRSSRPLSMSVYSDRPESRLELR